jgi:hypothetical protein
MALFNMADLRSALAPGRRLIGIDPGAKRIGVALSDTSLMLATPWGQLPRGKLRAVADALLVLARREEAGGLVCGLPLQMDGTAGRRRLRAGARRSHGAAGGDVGRTPVHQRRHPFPGAGTGRDAPPAGAGGGLYGRGLHAAGRA